MVQCGRSLFVLLTAVWAQVIIDDPQDTVPASPSTTYVWVTVTTAGAIATVRTPYFQEFLPVASAAASVEHGSVGLGTIDGEVGVTRQYSMLTLNGHGNNVVGHLSPGLGLLGVVFALVA